MFSFEKLSFWSHDSAPFPFQLCSCSCLLQAKVPRLNRDEGARRDLKVDVRGDIVTTSMVPHLLSAVTFQENV